MTSHRDKRFGPIDAGPPMVSQANLKAILAEDRYCFVIQADNGKFLGQYLHLGKAQRFWDEKTGVAIPDEAVQFEQANPYRVLAAVEGTLS